MIHPLSIVWNPSEGIDLGFFVIRYYSLMFIIAFGLGWYIMQKIFFREGESIEKLDNLFIWTVFATLIGARLGHVFFYDWAYFSEHPAEILLPVRFDPFRFIGFTGLASHGAAISIIVAMYFFSKKIMLRSTLWMLDRVVIPVASGAVFVRLGNFFNSEIYGNVTSGESFYAVKFVKDDEFWQNKDIAQITGQATEKLGYKAIETNPQFSQILTEIPFRHPAQLYEAFCYIFVFLILFYAYWKTDIRKNEGVLLGMFLVLLWSVRFVVEYVKASQGGFEENLGILSTGQWLSIPFILIGIVLIVNNGKNWSRFFKAQNK